MYLRIWPRPLILISRSWKLATSRLSQCNKGNLIHMASPRVAQVNPKADNDTFQSRNTFHRSSEEFDNLDAANVFSSPTRNSTADFESSDTLSLLRILGNIDPTKSSQEKNFTDFNELLANILEVASPTVEETAAEPRENNVGSHFDSEISVNSATSRGESFVSPTYLDSPSANSYVSPRCPELSVAEEISRLRPRKKPFRSTLPEKKHQSPSDELSKPKAQARRLIPNRRTKRKRVSTTEEDIDYVARENDIWGPQEAEQTPKDDTFDKDANDNSLNIFSPEILSEAKLAGLHSAAALFRRPSAASKKYTRAPMSKLFISLDLTAELFLKLQGAAKSYMLDDSFPERREAVGNKCRTSGDLSKLKLYSCAKNFLEDEGWGEHCFGRKAERADVRKLKWPESKNKIIELIIPLLRRMVTNERQRQYANETRMEKRLRDVKKRKRPFDCVSQSNQEPSITDDQSLLKGSQKIRNPNSLSIHVDSKLIPQLTPKLITTNEQATNQTNTLINSNTSRAETRIQGGDAMKEQSFVSIKIMPKFYVNILRDDQCVKRRFILTSSQCPHFSSLVHHVTQGLIHFREKVGCIKVHGPDGLISVYDEESWVKAIALVTKYEWMNKEVRCLISLEEPM
ncbi:BgTH12-03489 [Blumeria graminis f. sp. triticale]|uniref:Uncharacterized protein n=4 Tax=Blumeria graminis TaxID=34373 RepID=A0A656KKV3_BLUGR|nr:hypothetical protein BGT96224_3744 [Blumeria graminis f. sp. tritici 96224]CAD6499373.1 BgTH12-03489 [Blumeria graminis f. sp. triticale]VCU39515.1 Bgt-3744 [Blumeria graminis f. sp. tritici]